MVVIDTDGSAFITKAEFDSLKNNFQAQIDNYNSSIDSKIDGAIAAYLAGIKINLDPTEYQVYSDIPGVSLNRKTQNNAMEAIYTGNRSPQEFISGVGTDSTWGMNQFTSPPSGGNELDVLDVCPAAGSSVLYPGGPDDIWVYESTLFVPKNGAAGSDSLNNHSPAVPFAWKTRALYLYLSSSTSRYYLTALVSEKEASDNAIRAARRSCFSMFTDNSKAGEGKNKWCCAVNLFCREPEVASGLTSTVGFGHGTYLHDGTQLAYSPTNYTPRPMGMGGSTPEDLTKSYKYGGATVLCTDLYFFCNPLAQCELKSTSIDYFGSQLKDKKVLCSKPSNYFSIKNGSAKVYYWIDNMHYKADNFFMFIDMAFGEKLSGYKVPIEMGYNNLNGGYMKYRNGLTMQTTYSNSRTFEALGLDSENKVLFYDIPYTKDIKYYSLDLGAMWVEGNSDMVIAAGNLEPWIIQEGLHCEIKIYNKDNELVTTVSPY